MKNLLLKLDRQGHYMPLFLNWKFHSKQNIHALEPNGLFVPCTEGYMSFYRNYGLCHHSLNCIGSGNQNVIPCLLKDPIGTTFLNKVKKRAK